MPVELPSPLYLALSQKPLANAQEEWPYIDLARLQESVRVCLKREREHVEGRPELNLPVVCVTRQRWKYVVGAGQND